MTMFKNIKRSKLPGAYFQSDHGLLQSAFSKGKGTGGGGGVLLLNKIVMPLEACRRNSRWLGVGEIGGVSMKILEVSIELSD